MTEGMNRCKLLEKTPLSHSKSARAHEQGTYAPPSAQWFGGVFTMIRKFQDARRRLLRSACAAVLAVGGFAAAQPAIQSPPLLEPAKPGDTPKTIALVSAVGGQFQVVEARDGTASRIDPFKRRQLTISSQVLNHAVLRGLSDAVAQVQPDAKRVLLTVPALDVNGLGQAQRANAVASHLLKGLQALEQRKNWDYIIAVTPRYEQSAKANMGERLWGMGTFVYPLESAQVQVENENGTPEVIDIDGTEDVRSLDGKPVRSQQYVAPYAYLRFTLYDAKTLQIIRTVDRLDARKTADPNCTAAHVGDCFKPLDHAQQMLTLAERSASAGILGKLPAGRVEVGETKRVP